MDQITMDPPIGGTEMAAPTGRQLRMRGTGPAPKPRKPGGGRWHKEQAMQIAIVQWARARTDVYPCLAWLHHVPNGGPRSAREAAILAKAGLTRGIPDLCLPYPSGPYHGLYVELKYGRNKLTQEQAAFMEYAAGAGYATAVCRSAPDAQRVIEQYIQTGSERGELND